MFIFRFFVEELINAKPTRIDGNEYLLLIDKIKSFDIKLKLNTVVHAFNHEEDFNDFVSKAEPERWKVFQVLPIEGQNDNHINEYLIDSLVFEGFLKRHQHCATKLVPESNDMMKNSYWMIDPAVGSIIIKPER